MTIEDLISLFHHNAEAAVYAHPSAENGRREVADALFTVAIGHKLRTEGPAAVTADLQRLIELLAPMKATDEAVELLSADPSLLRRIVH